MGQILIEVTSPELSTGIVLENAVKWIIPIEIQCHLTETLNANLIELLDPFGTLGLGRISRILDLKSRVQHTRW